LRPRLTVFAQTKTGSNTRPDSEAVVELDNFTHPNASKSPSTVTSPFVEKRGSQAARNEETVEETILLSTESSDLYGGDILEDEPEEDHPQARPGRLSRGSSIIDLPTTKATEPSQCATFTRRTKKFCIPTIDMLVTLRIVRHAKGFFRPGRRKEKANSMGNDFIRNIRAGIVTSLISFPLMLTISANVGATPAVGVRTAILSCLINVLVRNVDQSGLHAPVDLTGLSSLVDVDILFLDPLLFSILA
jgi:hypothetical protein